MAGPEEPRCRGLLDRVGLGQLVPQLRAENDHAVRVLRQQGIAERDPSRLLGEAREAGIGWEAQHLRPGVVADEGGVDVEGTPTPTGEELDIAEPARVPG